MSRSSQVPPQEPDEDPPPRHTTAVLIARIRDGDDAARDELFRRQIGPLRRFAHGRLPGRARGTMETGDLVQTTLLRALRHVGSFDPMHEGAFLAYLRKSLLNQIRDVARRLSRSPTDVPLPEDLPDGGRPPLEEAIGAENVERYERAMTRLQGEQREAVMMRLEFGYTYREIAEALGRPSANAARMLVARGILKLAEEMRVPGEDS